MWKHRFVQVYFNPLHLFTVVSHFCIRRSEHTQKPINMQVMWRDVRAMDLLQNSVPSGSEFKGTSAVTQKWTHNSPATKSKVSMDWSSPNEGDTTFINLPAFICQRIIFEYLIYKPLNRCFYTSTLVIAVAWGIMFSGCPSLHPSVCPILVTVISQECFDGISSNSAQTST